MAPAKLWFVCSLLSPPLQLEGWGERTTTGRQWEHPTGLCLRGDRDQLDPPKTPGGQW